MTNQIERCVQRAKKVLEREYKATQSSHGYVDEVLEVAINSVRAVLIENQPEDWRCNAENLPPASNGRTD